MKEVMMAVSEMLPSVQFVHVDPTVSGGATSSSMLPLSGAAGLATGSSTLFSLLSREALDLRDVPVVCVVDVGRGVHFLERELDVLSVGSVGRWVQDVVAGKVKSVEEEMMEARRKGAERGVLEKEKEKEEKEEEEEEEEKIEEEKKEIEGGKEEEEGEVEWVKSNVGVGVVCGVCGVAGGMILSRGSGSGKKERKKTREGKGGKEGKGEADTENEEDKDDDGDEDGDGDENEEEEEEEEGIKKKGKGEETENKKKKKKKGKEGKGGKERKEGKEGKGKAKEN
ncbi:Protein disulfide-isomerase [Monocercomonoides exilis]|uniref:Protein disulfide-isomerase n=1 Tax=Monocercomonoides exilis TaxID=2049356 RepID=UPI0035594722|nr:Protein disulfide-isomerase [Monocercomonoides exilis]